MIKALTLWRRALTDLRSKADRMIEYVKSNKYASVRIKNSKIRKMFSLWNSKTIRLTPVEPVSKALVDVSNDSKKLQKKLQKKLLNEKNKLKKIKAERNKNLDTYAFDINRFPITKLIPYFTKLLRVDTVCQDGSRYIKAESIDRLLGKCGFHFSATALALFYAVLDPVRPLQSKYRIQIYEVDACVKAIIYCRERGFFMWNREYGENGGTYTSCK